VPNIAGSKHNPFGFARGARRINNRDRIKLSQEGEKIADGIGRTVVRNLKVMARMGVYFEEEVQKRYPEFPTRKGEWGWEDYLPPMSPGVRSLAEAYG